MNYKKFFKCLIAVLLVMGCIRLLSNALAPKYEYIKLDNGYSIEFCLKSNESITFPDKYKGEPVVEINSLVFGIRGQVKTLRIPDSVLNVKHEAFYDVESLEECYLGNNVQRIGESAFYNCANLRIVEIPASVTVIEENAFFGCEKITIYGYKDSYAEQYAKENGIPFVEKG